MSGRISREAALAKWNDYRAKVSKGIPRNIATVYPALAPMTTVERRTAVMDRRDAKAGARGAFGRTR